MKKILIVSPYFAPENSSASVRFTKIAKYLQQMGYDVTVICTRMNDKIVIDKSLEKDLKILKKVKRINYPDFLYYKMQRRFGAGSAPSKPEKGSSKGKKTGMFIDTMVWAYVYFCNYLLTKRYIRWVRKKNVKYDVIITTFSPLVPLAFGNYMKRKNLCPCWIVDFRDPLTLLNHNRLVGWFNHWYGIRLIRKADYVTTVSEGCAEKIVQEARYYHLDIEKIIRVITNGYDANERKLFSEVHVPSDKLAFAYCGTIYNLDGKIKNDISALFEALSNLIAEGKIDKNRIVIRYAGSSGGVVSEFAANYNLEDTLKKYGSVSRDESLRLQRESDVVVAAVWNNRKERGILSGKFYETLLVQRNVLAIVTGDEGDSELTRMIRKLKCGYAYEEINGDKSQLQDLEQWILRIYHEKMSDGEITYCSDGADLYSHSSLARQFAELF